MRKRLSMALVAAALVVLLATVTLVTRASGSSPNASGAATTAAAGSQPTLSPIQQLVFSSGEETPSRSGQAAVTKKVSGEGERDGHLAFCRLEL